MASELPGLERLTGERALTQLRRRQGRMAELGSEDGVQKLDWVEGVTGLLEHPSALAEVEEEAQALRRHGLSHIIWSGMGGSIMAVRVIVELGFLPALYPLDSTDPEALNGVVRRLLEAKGLTLESAVEPSGLRELLRDVLMIGVSMGMTSEEPVTHLSWFLELLENAGLPPEEHIRIMTLPGSHLDRFARERNLPSVPLQLDGGTGTPGRMSAPATRVFLLPAALALAGLPAPEGRLRGVLERGWELHDLKAADRDPASHPFVRLAAALSDTAVDGACRLYLDLPPDWAPLFPWIEQLLEESLGKGGKGVSVFGAQPLNRNAACYRPAGCARVRLAAGAVQRSPAGGQYDVILPFLAPDGLPERLAALAAVFLGWQLVTALYGYLQDITFAGQPAVEDYKARARALRAYPDPLSLARRAGQVLSEGSLTLIAPPYLRVEGHTPASLLASSLHPLEACFQYLDLTVNGELSAAQQRELEARWSEIGRSLLGVPIKLRRAPAAYHSTEQSEMNGPAPVFSLRLLLTGPRSSLLGSYDDRFLRAQAVGTWQAMVQQGHACFLLVVAGDTTAEVDRLLQDVERLVAAG